MKWIVAIVGAAFIFCGSLCLFGLMYACLSEMIYVELALLVAVPLSLLAGYRSFRGTLRHYNHRPA